MNMLVMIEDQKTKERHECRTYSFGSASDVPCPAKVVQVQEVG
jgi:hypothetical protein